VVGALAGLIMVQLPGALALPAFSTLLVLSGLGLAAASHFKGLRMEHGGTDSYTIAGLLVFLGFAIALLTDAEQTLVFFDEMETQGLANFSK